MADLFREHLVRAIEEAEQQLARYDKATAIGPHPEDCDCPRAECVLRAIERNPIDFSAEELDGFLDAIMKGRVG